jgi:signal transduction histidine kinase
VTAPRIEDRDRLQQLVDAVLAIGSDLSLPTVLHRIVEVGVSLVDAQYGALGVLDAERIGLSEFVHVGVTPEQVAEIGDLPSGHGILGLLIVDPKPIRLPDIAAHPDSYGFPPSHPPMHSFLGVPITIRGEVFGNLYLTEKQGAAEFSAEDEALAVALAGAAAIAIENTRLQVRVRDLALVADRERIAADLHDRVIQRLFATGLGLEAIVRMVEPEVAARVEQAVSDLDATIKEIRSAIFALQPPRIAGRSLRSEILSLTTEAAASLGFEPRLRIDGPIDQAVADTIAEQLLATLREALSNVVRHAQASAVDVMVAVADGWLSLEVADDGIGPGATSSTGRGVTNMTRRAEDGGGALTVTPVDGGGTRLLWRVPLRVE